MTPNRTSPLRLTFNKPVVLHNFVDHGDEQTRGFKVRIEDGLVHFLPISEVKDADDVHLIGDKPNSFARKRGGAEIQIAGSMAAQVAKAFRNPAGPFFTLSREKDGWLVARPHSKPEAPSRLVAHLRVWNEEHGRIVRNSNQKRNASATAAPPKVRVPKQRENVFDFSEAADRVRRAKTMIEETSTVRRPGRPGREITDARATMVAFEQLVSEVGGQPVDVDGELGRMRSELSRTKAELQTAQSELSQAREMLAQAQSTLKDYGERQKDAIHETQHLLNRVFPNHRKDEPAQTKARQTRVMKAQPAVPPAKAPVAKAGTANEDEPVLVRRGRTDRKENRRGARPSARSRRAMNA